MSKNSSILFSIGGSGITVALSHLQALRESLQENQGEKKQSRVHSIRLVWAVRDAILFENVHQHNLLEWRESSMFTRQVHFRMDVHVTGVGMPAPQLQCFEHAKDEGLNTSIATVNSKEVEVTGLESPHSEVSADFSKDHEDGLTDVRRKVQIFHHRPEVQRLIINCAKEWHASHEKLAVICCGPGKMVDDARTAVVAAIRRHMMR